jgi:hypothetical protein
MHKARPAAISSRTALVDALRRYELPDRKLTLCPDRRPFERLPHDVIEQIAASAVSVSERGGRYTDAVREVLGAPTPVLDSYIVIESHIDLTYLDDDLAFALVAAGFEPDDFALMEPARYIHHFTQQFVCATPDRVAELHRLLIEGNAAAIRIIDQHPVASGYLETEVYRSEYSTRYVPTDLSTNAVRQFPSDRLRFEIRAVPQSAAEAKSRNMPLHARRAADIHIKLPGGFGPGSWKSADRLIQQRRANRPVAEELLVDRLAAAGFYEIISQAGNFLFSAHFADMTEANEAFHVLNDFARRAGGITGLVREGCSSIWRKGAESGGETILAQVPPLLSASWSTVDVQKLASSGE